METEAKFIVPGEEAFARLRNVERFGPYEKRDEHTKVVHDRYVDTPDHRFYRKQLYVRLREGKQGDVLLTIKSLGELPKGAIHAREEYQVQVPSLARADWPQSEVRSMVEDVAGDQPLGDLVGIDQTRAVSILYDGTRAVAELSLDQVTVQTDHEPVTIYELEAELLPNGLPSDLKILERIFSEEYGLASQPLTKFERAMTLAEPDKAQRNGKHESGTAKAQKKKHTRSENHVEPLLESGLSAPTAVVNGTGDAGAQTRNLSGDRTPTIPVSSIPNEASPAENTASDNALQPIDSSDTAARKIVAAYFKDMTSNEDGTRQGEDPEVLHDMRVATRRMRATLRVLGPYLHNDIPARLNRGLKEVAHSLGAVRDLDVLIGNAQAFRDTLPEDVRPGLDGLIESWQSDRGKARDHLVDLLGSKEYKRFKSRVRKFTKRRDTSNPDDALAGGELHPYQIRHIAPSAILDRYEAVRCFEALAPEAEALTNPDADAASQPSLPPPIEQLHALRISGKYLRYTLEFFREILPAEAADLIRDVTTMQDQLGQLHDADVASALIREYIDKQKKRRKRSNPPNDVPSGLTAYLQDRETAVRTIHADFHSTWATLQSPQWRAKLSVVILA